MDIDDIKNQLETCLNIYITQLIETEDIIDISLFKSILRKKYLEYVNIKKKEYIFDIDIIYKNPINFVFFIHYLHENEEVDINVQIVNKNLTTKLCILYNIFQNCIENNNINSNFLCGSCENL